MWPHLDLVADSTSCPLLASHRFDEQGETMAVLNQRKFLGQIILELVKAGVLESEDDELRDQEISKAIDAIDAKIKEKEREKRERDKAAAACAIATASTPAS